MMHFVKILITGGRGSAVIQNTLLSDTDNAFMSLRVEFPSEFFLSAVVYHGHQQVVTTTARR